MVGDAGALFRAAAPRSLAVLAIERPEAGRYAPGVIEVIQAGPALPDDLPFGRVDARAGRAAYDAVVLAAGLARDGRVRALVTAPLHKEALHAAGVAHPGHTEILAELAGGADVRMMLFNDELRVVLATIHVPLSAVPGLLSLPAELRTIRLAADAAPPAGHRPRRASRWPGSIRTRARAGCSGARRSRSSNRPSSAPAPRASTPRARGPATRYSCRRAPGASTWSWRSTTIRA